MHYFVWNEVNERMINLLQQYLSEPKSTKVKSNEVFLLFEGDDLRDRPCLTDQLFRKQPSRAIGGHGCAERLDACEAATAFQTFRRSSDTSTSHITRRRQPCLRASAYQRVHNAVVSHSFRHFFAGRDCAASMGLHTS